MSHPKEKRWKQRFQNFQKALTTLSEAVDLATERSLSNLEKQGLIQAFEFTHELYWKTVKDFFEEKGMPTIYGSKDATREAFNNSLISNGEDWMEMIESRNLSSHTYNQEISEDIVQKILKVYYKLFVQFKSSMQKHF